MRTKLHIDNHKSHTEQISIFGGIPTQPVKTERETFNRLKLGYLESNASVGYFLLNVSEVRFIAMVKC